MNTTTNRFAQQLNRFAQTQQCAWDFVHEPFIVTNVARTNENGAHFSNKTGADVFTITVESVNNPGYTMRVLAKGTLARQLAKVEFILDATIVRLSGEFDKGARMLDANGRQQRNTLFILQGDLVKGYKAFEVVSLDGQTDISDDNGSAE